MITVLSRFEMQKGKEDMALQAVNRMGEAVKAEEPGCLVFSVTRGQVNHQEIYIYEVYRDKEAFELHRKTPHQRELQAAFDDCLDRASFNIEILDQVAGFIRQEAVNG